jgi:hypothetical protein
MFASVTKYRPAIRSASSFPEAIIRLKAEPVIDPSGKASCAATSRRNGVVGVTAPGAGCCTVMDSPVENFLAGADFVAGYRR